MVVVLLLVEVFVDEVEVDLVDEVLVLSSDLVTKARAAPAPTARITQAAPMSSINFQGYEPDGGP